MSHPILYRGPAPPTPLSTPPDLISRWAPAAGQSHLPAAVQGCLLPACRPDQHPRRHRAYLPPSRVRSSPPPPLAIDRLPPQSGYPTPPFKLPKHKRNTNRAGAPPYAGSPSPVVLHLPASHPTSPVQGQIRPWSAASLVLGRYPSPRSPNGLPGQQQGPPASTRLLTSWPAGRALLLTLYCFFQLLPGLPCHRRPERRRRPG
jgi:hypothetical protein